MGAALRSILRCSGCGAALPPLRDAPLPFRCPRADAGDDVDHVLARVLDPEGEGQGALQSAGAGESPFVMYRGLLHSYQAAREAGLDEAGYVAVASAADTCRRPASADFSGTDGKRQKQTRQPPQDGNDCRVRSGW